MQTALGDSGNKNAAFTTAMRSLNVAKMKIWHMESSEVYKRRTLGSSTSWGKGPFGEFPIITHPVLVTPECSEAFVVSCFDGDISTSYVPLKDGVAKFSGRHSSLVQFAKTMDRNLTVFAMCPSEESFKDAKRCWQMVAPNSQIICYWWEKRTGDLLGMAVSLAIEIDGLVKEAVETVYTYDHQVVDPVVPIEKTNDIVNIQVLDFCRDCGSFNEGAPVNDWNKYTDIIAKTVYLADGKTSIGVRFVDHSRRCYSDNPGQSVKGVIFSLLKSGRITFGDCVTRVDKLEFKPIREETAFAAKQITGHSVKGMQCGNCPLYFYHRKTGKYSLIARNAHGDDFGDPATDVSLRKPSVCSYGGESSLDQFYLEKLLQYWSLATKSSVSIFEFTAAMENVQEVYPTPTPSKPPDPVRVRPAGVPPHAHFIGGHWVVSNKKELLGWDVSGKPLPIVRVGGSQEPTPPVQILSSSVGSPTNFFGGCVGGKLQEPLTTAFMSCDPPGQITISKMCFCIYWFLCGNPGSGVAVIRGYINKILSDVSGGRVSVNNDAIVRMIALMPDLVAAESGTGRYNVRGLFNGDVKEVPRFINLLRTHDRDPIVTANCKRE